MSAYMSNRYLTSGSLVRQSGLGSAKVSSLANPTLRVSSWEVKGLDDQRTPSALQGRLEEILVFELDQFGQTQYHHMSVRALYKYVLEAITQPFHPPPSKEGPYSPKEGSNGDDNARDPTSDVNETMSNTGAGQKEVTFDLPSASTRGIATLQADRGDATRQTEPETDNATHRERLGGWLHPRDMRRLVTPFSASNEPGLIVRRHVMLLNFDPLRAVILRDRLLVLVPEGADSILIQLEERVRGGSMEVENSIFGSEAGERSNENDLTKAEAGSYGALLGKAHGQQWRDDSVRNSSHGSAPLRSVTLDSTGSRGIAAPVNGALTKATRAGCDADVAAATLEPDSDTNSEWEEMQASDWTDLPFELQAADSVLFVVCSILSQDAYQLQEDTLAYIHDILKSQSGLQDDPLVGIRHIKDSVREMSSRIKGFVQSMNRVLDDDEDMALMNLSRLRTHPHRFLKPVSKEILDEEADEPELILEAHLQIGLTLQNALDLIQGQIDTASELVDQKLDASRNRLLFTNMVLNLLTLCISMGTFVAGVFGMNLEIELSKNLDAFGEVVWGTVGGMFLTLVLMIWGLMWLGIVPRSIFRT